METVAELEKILEPGEKVIWSARPDFWRFARPTFMLYIVAVPWTVFTYFWLATVTDGFQWPKPTQVPFPWWMPWVAIWFGIALLIIGGWMLSAPYWIWREGRRTIHALTDRRALIVVERRSKKTRTLDLEGQIEFKISDPDDAVSDLDVITGSGKGVLFRAVIDPKRVVSTISQTR